MSETGRPPRLSELFFSFFKLGLTSFGGPAMVAYIRELSVHRKKWLGEETFKDGVALCQSVPGATAMQTAAYVGLRARGIPGAFASYTGFGLPAFILMVIFSSIYMDAHALPQVVSLFSGLQVIVVAIIANATFSFGKGTLKHTRDYMLSVLSAALFGAGVSPFAVIAGSALAGILLYRGDYAFRAAEAPGAGKSLKKTGLLFLAAALWLVFLFLADKRLFSLSALMMRIDIFAFGGGFASLPLMMREIVEVRGWLDYKTFMDGIALGQVTPGPIVITAAFIGYQLYRLAGAAAATVSIFTPSFLMVVAVTPFFDRLKTSRYFLRAIKGILASFAGLLFYVAVKFGLAVPWDAARTAFGFAALIALVRKTNILYVVLAGAVVSFFIF